MKKKGVAFLKIAVAQFSPTWENKEQSMAKAESWIKEAAQKNAEFIFFPELSLTGFSMKVDSIRDQLNETESFMKSSAIKYQIGIGIGYVPAGDGLGRNTYLIVDANGEQLLSYDKIHPFSFAKEDQFYQGGERVITGNIGGIPVGIGICFDLRFPELYRAMMPKPHLLLIPANWPLARIEQWKILLRARAVENQVFVMGINCAGNLGGVYYSGESIVVNPLGEVIYSGKKDSEDLFLCEIDDQIEKMRQHFPVLEDRKSREFWTLVQESEK